MLQYIHASIVCLGLVGYYGFGNLNAPRTYFTDTMYLGWMVCSYFHIFENETSTALKQGHCAFNNLSAIHEVPLAMLSAVVMAIG